MGLENIMLLPTNIAIFSYSCYEIKYIFVDKLKWEVFEQNIDIVFKYFI